MVSTVDQTAPGDLEQVRELLNTWYVPNDTRTPTDLFRGSAAVREFRDDVRRLVERKPGAERLLDRWVDRLDARPRIRDGHMEFRARGAAGAHLGTVLLAVADGTWPRLKACPDCRWVFYDNSRNGSKRWCLMNAGSPNGRACGTIAKVRAFRERERARRTPVDTPDPLVRPPAR
jgi:predicted RNA-binding Zn ribbon-like protein